MSSANQNQVINAFFSRNNKPDEDAVTDVTIVIMKGKASLAELKKMFK